MGEREGWVLVPREPTEASDGCIGEQREWVSSHGHSDRPTEVSW